MSISTIKKYGYQPPFQGPSPLFFEIEHIQMETSCTANRNHRSEHYSVFFLKEGNGKYQIDFKQFSINGAGIFFLSPGQVLTVESEALKTGYQISFNREFYCVETHGKEIACNGVLFNNIHKATFLQLIPETAILFQQLIDNMLRELTAPGKAHQEMLEAYLRLFVIEALRQYHDQTSNKLEINEVEDKSRLVGDFIALVDKHFRKIHTVADYAEMLYVSPKSLAKRLKAHEYPTPTEVIRDRIVLQAKRDLRYSQKSVKEIAFELGFDDPAYFTRYFKKAEQQSPQSYRSAYFEAEK